MVATLLWCSWWAVGAWGLKAGLEAWLEDRRSAGWQAEWADLSVRGFPNRFDVTLTDVQLADTRAGWVWTAPRFDTFALSYTPTDIRVHWPPMQRLQTEVQTLVLQGNQMVARAKLAPSEALTLRDVNMVFEGLQITSDQGWDTTLARAQLATRPLEDPLTYQLWFDATDWVPPIALFEMSADLESLPDALGQVHAELTVTFDAPWDRYALERARPQPTAIKIDKMQATWGQLELAVAGEMTVDSTGRPRGDVLVKARNWRDILALGVSSGMVPRDLAGPVEAGLGLLSQLAGHPETLDIPLSLRDGQMFVGPVSLGPGPNLRLR